MKKLLISLLMIASASAQANGSSVLSRAGIVERSNESRILSTGAQARLTEIRKARTTRSATLAAIDAQAFTSTVVTVSLPDGEILTIRKSHDEKGPDGITSWVGKIDSGGNAVFTIKGTEVVGSIQRPRGRYIIQSLSGKYHVIQELEPKGFPPEHSPSAPTGAPESIQKPRGDLDRKSANFQSTAAANQSLNILVAFTPAGLQAAPGGYASASTAIALLNQSLRDSDVNLPFPSIVSVISVLLAATFVFDVRRSTLILFKPRTKSVADYPMR